MSSQPLQVFTQGPQLVNADINLPTTFPDLPVSVHEKFGQDIDDYENSLNTFWQSVKTALSENVSDTSAAVAAVQQSTNNVSKSLTTSTAKINAAIKTEQTVRADADGALADTITTLSAEFATTTTDLQSQITDEETTRANADSTMASELTTLTSSVGTLTSNVSTILATYASTSYVTAQVGTAVTAANAFTSAQVLTESNARVTSDGNLSGQFTLQVIAGTVVTGLNITSSSSPSGGTTSEIAFLDSVFKIYTAAGHVAPFQVSGSVVELTNVVVTGELDIGSGASRVQINNGGGLTIGGGTISILFSSGISIIRCGGWGFDNHGAAQFDSLALTHGATVGGNLTVTGATILSSTVNLVGIATFFGGVDITTSLDVFGTSRHHNGLEVSGAPIFPDNGISMIGSIEKQSPDGWTPPLNDGSNDISLSWSGTNLLVKIGSSVFTVTITP